MLRSSVAISLARRGLIDWVPNTPKMREGEASVVPTVLSRVRLGDRLAGLRVAHEVTLACYDRKRVSAPPQNLDQLLALAASGAAVGLSVDPIGLWWTSGGFGATDALAPAITRTSVPAGSRPDSLAALERWLQWLRQASLQNRVDIASSHQELLRGLVEGRLAWAPCFSLAVMDLEKRMDGRLGVSALPVGPAGPATPFTAVQV